MDYEKFEDLTREHGVMLEFLSAGVALCSAQAWPIFLRLLEKIHHHKEEFFLFPLLLGSERLQVGGPKCMTFFTPRVLGGTGWVDGHAQLLALISPAPFASDGGLSPFRNEVLRSGSMLKIPVEDHMLGALALQQLGAETDLARRTKLFDGFASLLKEHIQREDECLFELFRQALSPEQKKEYAQKASAFDEQMNTAGILRGLRGAQPG
jgi:hypothetical protein